MPPAPLVNFAAQATTAFGMVYLWTNRTHRYKRGYSQVDALGFFSAMALFALHTLFWNGFAYYVGDVITNAEWAEHSVFRFTIYFLSAAAGWASVSLLGFRGIGDFPEGLSKKSSGQLSLFSAIWVVVGLVETVVVYFVPLVFLHWVGNYEYPAVYDEKWRAHLGFWLYAAFAIATPAALGLVNYLLRMLVPGVYEKDTKQLPREVFKAVVWTLFNIGMTVPTGILQAIFTYENAWVPGVYKFLDWPFYVQLIGVAVALVAIAGIYFVSMFIVSDDDRKTVRSQAGALGPKDNVAIFGKNLFREIRANSHRFHARQSGYNAVKQP